MRGGGDAWTKGRTTVPEVAMSDCTIYKPLLHLLVDGEISPSERAELEAHLAVCPDCRERLAQLESIRDAFALLDVEVPAGLRERTMAAVRQEARRERRRRAQRWVQGLGALAACCVLAFLGLRITGGTGSNSNSNVNGAALYQTAPREREDAAEPDTFMNAGVSGGAYNDETDLAPASADGIETKRGGVPDVLDTADVPGGATAESEGFAQEVPPEAPAEVGVGFQAATTGSTLVETGEAAVAQWLAENRPGEEGPYDLTEAEAEALTAYLAERDIDLVLPWPVTLVWIENTD